MLQRFLERLCRIQLPSASMVTAFITTLHDLPHFPTLRVEHPGVPSPKYRLALNPYLRGCLLLGRFQRRRFARRTAMLSGSGVVGSGTSLSQVRQESQARICPDAVTQPHLLDLEAPTTRRAQGPDPRGATLRWHTRETSAWRMPPTEGRPPQLPRLSGMRSTGNISAPAKGWQRVNFIN